MRAWSCWAVICTGGLGRSAARQREENKIKPHRHRDTEEIRNGDGAKWRGGVGIVFADSEIRGFAESNLMPGSIEVSLSPSKCADKFKAGSGQENCVDHFSLRDSSFIEVDRGFILWQIDNHWD